MEDEEMEDMSYQRTWKGEANFTIIRRDMVTWGYFGLKQEGKSDVA
jgi:hypothetical protein